MRFLKVAICGAVVLVLVAGPAWAAPLRPITSPPTQPEISYTGPQIDPHAKRGQWFMNITPPGTEPVFESRTHEFYDNVMQSPTGGIHGGGNAGSAAIRGMISNIAYDDIPGVPPVITGFTISATVENDLPGRGQGAAGFNSHDESWQYNERQRKLPLLGTKLTAEFAVDPRLSPPDPWTGAYQPPTPPRIEAINHDELAWYCWTPDNPVSSRPLYPYGGYYVPTWDFGDIPPGGQSSRRMEFKVSPVITPDSWYYQALQELQETQQDVLLNRTTSLKISNWVDTLGIDDGTPYPGFIVNPDIPPPALSSDVSVFCNVPEPSTLVMLAGIAAMGLLGVIRRRRNPQG